ncbi:hypothetical protein [Brasilonema sp. UFV-L1]|uniref:hypothetical protein n=1 Tax=Brasilonema sp. UFV-L1 TaxID=2234130 RepID=UPI00145DE02B|nr:hypothetical protein [Brasilonema sp. UFV-L1]NMG07681.1 hypothetical protein [Brasilonema sp. UFV-L1]
MDNKPLELQAEKLIEHKLIKHGFLVTKPSFDKQGTDLLIIKDISKKMTPFIKVQCKGRTIKKSSNVRINQKYVEQNFVLFLYLEEDNRKDDYLYIFFDTDIKKWRIEGENFSLAIPINFQTKEEFKERLFNKEAIIKLENILLRQAVNKPIKTSNSIIIDGIFLEKVAKETQRFYKELYPEKTFQKLSIDAIVEQLLTYTHIERRNEVNCYLIYSEHFSLEYLVDIGEITEHGFFMGDMSESVGRNYNLYKQKTGDFVLFKVEELLHRIINVDNILLVADDFGYVPYLQDLKERGVEILIFQCSENSGSRMYHQFKWANVIYPLGLAMGLKEYEL